MSTFHTNLTEDNRKIFRSVISYRKYGSRMMQRFLNRNLIVSLTWDFLKIGPQIINYIQSDLTWSLSATARCGSYGWKRRTQGTPRLRLLNINSSRRLLSADNNTTFNDTAAVSCANIIQLHSINHVQQAKIIYNIKMGCRRLAMFTAVAANSGKPKKLLKP